MQMRIISQVSKLSHEPVMITMLKLAYVWKSYSRNASGVTSQCDGMQCRLLMMCVLSIDVLIRAAACHVQAATSWMRSNRLQPNPDKTEVCGARLPDDSISCPLHHC